MNFVVQRAGSLLRSVVVMTAFLVIGLLSRADAQWQAVYGDTNTQAGRAGVQQTFDGGYIAVGESDTSAPVFDIYVVKTDPMGNVMWANRYDIGHHDYGKDIQQTRDSGYVVTGYTYDSSNCCTRNNIFLMKLDQFGNAQWTRVYGGDDDEQGWCVREIDSVAGYIVAGRSSSFGQGNYDGLLMRTYADGTVNWSRVYGETKEDYFLGCTHLTTDSTDEIVATGATFSYGSAQQAWLMKVNGNDGVPIWTHVYGTSQNDLFRSVRETSTGTFIIAGYTTFPFGTAEGLLVETASNGAVIATAAYGGAGWSELTDVQEMPGGGTYVTTGLFRTVAGGYLNYDVYVGTFFPGWWRLSDLVVGGSGDDMGFSIAPAGGNVIVAGLSTSFGNGQQLYLINTPTWGGECNLEPDVDSVDVQLDSTGIVPTNSRLSVSCDSYAYSHDLPEFYPVCNRDSLSKAVMRVEDDSSGAYQYVEPQLSATSGDAVMTYPNPVRQGNEFTIACTVAEAAMTEIIVSDLTGRLVQLTVVQVAAGPVEISISTNGWAAGTYLVKLRTGEGERTVRVVVTE